MKARPEFWIVLLALLAAAVKWYCAATTFGTVDVHAYYLFAQSIDARGVTETYRALSVFNHPPLVGHYLGAAFLWAGGDPQLFALFHRLPGIAADLLVVLLFLHIRRLTGRPAWWALGLLAASPLSFMISGFHGNYDPLLPLGMTLAIVACLHRQAVWCGIFLGLTCQVKIIPLLATPVFFFFWLHRGRGWQFAVAVAATVLAGWLEPLLTVPQIYLRQVLAYNSTWGWWGVSYLLSQTGVPELSGVVSAFAANPVQGLVVNVLKLTVIGSALAFAWFRRKEEAASLLATLAFVWVVFLVFAPGFGVQYLAWVAPFLLWYSVRWFAVFTVIASVSLFVFYTAISHGLPWNRGLDLKTTFGVWAPALLPTWGLLAAFLVLNWREFFAIKSAHTAAPAA